MTQKILIADPSWTVNQAQTIASQQSCCAYVSGIPMSSSGIAEMQGWTVPCVIVEDLETLEIVSWSALPPAP